MEEEFERQRGMPAGWGRNGKSFPLGKQEILPAKPVVSQKQLLLGRNRKALGRRTESQETSQDVGSPTRQEQRARKVSLRRRRKHSTMPFDCGWNHGMLGGDVGIVHEGSEL